MKDQLFAELLESVSEGGAILRGTQEPSRQFDFDSQTDWQKLKAMCDEEIDLSDIPELIEEQLKRAKPFRQFLSERSASHSH